MDDPAGAAPSFGIEGNVDQRKDNQGREAAHEAARIVTRPRHERGLKDGWWSCSDARQLLRMAN